MSLTGADHPRMGRLARFRAWSLTAKFAVGGGVIIFVAMLVSGSIVSRIVSAAAVEHNATSTALFIDSFITPLVQDIATGDLSPAQTAELDQLLGSHRFEGRFPHLDVWKDTGEVVYSKSPELIGLRFALPEGARLAFDGDVVSRYTDLTAQEHVLRDFDVRLLEIYVPVREFLTGRVIGVAEIHEVPEHLQNHLRSVRVRTWVVVAGVTLAVMLGLFGVISRADRLIRSQRSDLLKRITEFDDLSRMNMALRERVQRASRRATEFTEAHLRRIGADLHDGPAQLVSLASLKVEQVRRAGAKADRESELRTLELTLTDALRDIRAISRGLMLPEIEALSLPEVVSHAVHAHEKRTETRVTLTCGPLPGRVAPAVKICVYRFLQEGLNNAYRHAAGAGQQVDCRSGGGNLTVIVSDAGGDRPDGPQGGAGLGLTGLRERIESLGGTFDRRRNAGGGTTIEMRLEIPEER